MNDLISLIVPVYNVEKYLDKCLETITSQTYSNIEIILIDDGSTDLSGEKCDKWGQKDNRVRVIHKKNGGLSSARNAGIDIAKGKYISFIDSDDYIDTNMIETLLNIINNYKAEIAICNRYYVFENEKKYIRYDDKITDLVMNSENAIFELNNFKYFDMSAWAKIYDKRLFEDIRFPVDKLSEDYYIMYLLLDKATNIVYHSKPLYYYVQRVGSISKNKKINFDFIEAAYQQMKYVEQKYPKLETCVKAAYASANMTVYNMVLKSKGKCNRSQIKQFQNEVRKYLNDILNYSEWSFIKKVQAYLFVRTINLYNLTFKLLRKVKKV